MKKITLLLSFVACVLLAQAQTQVANIAALKAANATLAFGTTSTTTFTITGEVVVTFVSLSTSGARTIYIQDATGAFMVYDGATTKYFTASPALYSGLTGLTGTVKSYAGILEMLPTVAPAAATSTGHTPFTPIETTLDNLINYPMQVCLVKNVKISDFTTYTSGTTTYTPNGMFQSSKNFPLSVGGVTSTTVLRTSYADANYVNTAIPTTVNQDITGISLPYQASATAAVIVDFIPRTLSDIKAVTGLFDVAVDKLNVKVVGSKLSIENATSTYVEIFNATGAKAQSGKLNEGSIELKGLLKGLYIVKVGTATAKIML